MAARRRFVDHPLSVAVLMGGSSPERGVSLESGLAVADALRERGHRVTEIDPAETKLALVDWTEHDLAFLALHGTGGEDGTVQAQLDEFGVRYTGSGTDASRLAFSKSAAKACFLRNGVPTPPSVLVHQADDARRIRECADAIDYPLVVKPDAQGSSLGVGFVREPESLARALTNCFHFDAFGLMEPLIEGSEWTLAVFDDEPLPLVRIRSGREFYDYTAKYADDGTAYDFEFDEPADVVANLRRAGLAACRALGTRGWARADVRLDRDGQPWVLEVNTIPGMTSHSLVPKAASRAGLSFADVCERAIAAALEPVSAPIRRVA